MLRILGLSAAEQALYEALVEHAPVTLGELDRLAARHAPYAPAGALAARLEELGLIARLPEDPPRYVVVPPEMGLDALIRERARELADARRRVARLSARYHRTAAAQESGGLVEVVIGREAVLHRFDQLQRGTRKEIRVFDAPPYVGVVGGNTQEFELLSRGVDYRVVYDRRAIEVRGTLQAISEYIAAGEQVRVGDVPMKLVLSDYPMALVPLRSDLEMGESALVVHDSTLLDALAALFEMYWERAVPLHIRHGRAHLAETTGPTGARRDLLARLVAGQTDKAIAAHLGWSDRTVRRHVRAMMVQLDAQTRFQAGYQAVLRGWLADENSDGVALEDLR
ncbi:transcriptional regulator TrmB [Nonomuraea sp. SMC257]|uniref:Transcriptional regulator TrmB n=1 Tax=Nonomuraea montanisoli TaxID=2741721 RepID=A0A7Y6I9K4_9ACTN|nr:LuxR C-terminal-related transcriptional regulator [Nonomuraea montanisoli]NUW33981.1 transcriptional regulator TrmB [Nonomuraea montanisoli]